MIIFAQVMITQQWSHISETCKHRPLFRIVWVSYSLIEFRCFSQSLLFFTISAIFFYNFCCFFTIPVFFFIISVIFYNLYCFLQSPLFFYNLCYFLRYPLVLGLNDLMQNVSLPHFKIIKKTIYVNALFWANIRRLHYCFSWSQS